MASSFFQRYEKARQNCVLFHLEDWAAFRLSGTDAQDYLHRISTADVKACNAGEGRQALFLGGDGRVVADCALLSESIESYYLVCPAACKDGLAAQLDHFLFAEDVTVKEVTDQYYLALLAGPGASEMRQLMGSLCEGAAVSYMSADVEFAPASMRSIFLINTEKFQQVKGKIYETLEHRNGVIGDQDMFTTFRVEEGCPMYGKDISEKTIPLEANQKQAISFTKGCFPGQEIVARINNLGHPANILVGLTLPETSDKLAGRELRLGDKKIGHITSVCYSPLLRSSLGLGYVKWNQREPGQVLEIEGDEAFRAVVVELPLPGVSE